ncbi:MAG: site-specific DNA-methyltransferase [Phycisphaerae bacterium]|nr:site-specific DNA-methyltransferase [Phycisphaerae bacterium]
MKPKIGIVNHGDCISGMKMLDAGCVDLVFADPPFNIGYEYDSYDDRQDRERYLSWCRDWMAEVYRVLKPDGTFWLAIGDEYAAELKLIAQNAFPTIPLNANCGAPDEGRQCAVAREAGASPFQVGKRRKPVVKGGASSQTGGFHCRSWVIWYYTFGVHCQNKFTRSHAHLFQLVKDPARFTFNVDAIRVPSARQLVYGDKRANSTGRTPDDTWIIPPAVTNQKDEAATSVRDRSSSHLRTASTVDGFTLRPQDIPDRFEADSDTWYFSRVAGTFKEREGWHGCQMPEQLLGRIIRACSNENELVLDPFSGSGTTLAVARKLGRTPIGFEMSEQYAMHAQRRLSAVSPGDPLDGAADPLTSAPLTSNGRKLRDVQTRGIAQRRR